MPVGTAKASISVKGANEKEQERLSRTITTIVLEKDSENEKSHGRRDGSRFDGGKDEALNEAGRLTGEGVDVICQQDILHGKIYIVVGTNLTIPVDILSCRFLTPRSCQMRVKAINKSPPAVIPIHTLQKIGISAFSSVSSERKRAHIPGVTSVARLASAGAEMISIAVHIDPMNYD